MQDKIKKLWKSQPQRLNWDLSPTLDPDLRSSSLPRHRAVSNPGQGGSCRVLQALYSSATDQSQRASPLIFSAGNADIHAEHARKPDSDDIPGSDNVSVPAEDSPSLTSVHAVLDLAGRKHSSANKLAVRKLLEEHKSRSIQRKPQLRTDIQGSGDAVTCERSPDGMAPATYTQQNDVTGLMPQPIWNGEDSATLLFGQRNDARGSNGSIARACASVHADAVSTGQQGFTGAGNRDDTGTSAVACGVEDSGAVPRTQQACLFRSTVAGLSGHETHVISRQLSKNTLHRAMRAWGACC